jgi:hypothetical protein
MVKKVVDVWGTAIVQLNCHLHPLNTIASSYRAALRHLEEENKLIGKDCCCEKKVYR